MRSGQQLVESGFVGYADVVLLLKDRAVALRGGSENGRGGHPTAAWKAWLRFPASWWGMEGYAAASVAALRGGVMAMGPRRRAGF